MAISLSTRTLKLLRDEGWIAQSVQYWNSFAHVRHDLFGFIDVLAIRDCETLAVQCTSASNHASRRKKSQDSPILKKWLTCPCRRFEVWSWKKDKHGWQVRREAVSTGVPANLRKPIIAETPVELLRWLHGAG